MKERIDDLLAGFGLDQWGVCSFESLPVLLNCRAKSRLPQNAATVLVFLFPYYVGEFPQRNVSRYVLADDYHHLTGQLLTQVTEGLGHIFPQEQWVWFVDNSPIPEVSAAWLAGLGVIGRNGQLINQRYGSYTFIGCVVTTLALEPGSPLQGSCLNCGKCFAACPTGALRAEGFEKERCLSHITQKKGELTPWEQEQVAAGGFIWGCDRCQDACPHNASPLLTPLQGFRENIQPVLTEENLPRLVEQKAYNWRGESVLRRNAKLIADKNG
ncbi:QueG-associated DUF1730 domain-containing protein [Oscillospiraceae bacterium MB08-C2-2]|nr:QueG-associated DUF1730 domain-containing protein [Oscillospiraceae bacterium MB08-C2-2]